MISYLGYFLLNFILELGVARLCLPIHGIKRLATAFLILNLATHPLLWFYLSQVFSGYWTHLFVAEMLALAVEITLGWLLLAGVGVSRARIVLTVFACNLFSFAFTFIV